MFSGETKFRTICNMALSFSLNHLDLIPVASLFNFAQYPSMTTGEARKLQRDQGGAKSPYRNVAWWRKTEKTVSQMG
jgi:hypothetical protein